MNSKQPTKRTGGLQRTSTTTSTLVRAAMRPSASSTLSLADLAAGDAAPDAAALAEPPALVLGRTPHRVLLPAVRSHALSPSPSPGLPASPASRRRAPGTAQGALDRTVSLTVGALGVPGRSPPPGSSAEHRAGLSASHGHLHATATATATGSAGTAASSPASRRRALGMRHTASAASSAAAEAAGSVLGDDGEEEDPGAGTSRDHSRSRSGSRVRRRDGRGGSHSGPSGAGSERGVRESTGAAGTQRGDSQLAHSVAVSCAASGSASDAGDVELEPRHHTHSHRERHKHGHKKEQEQENKEQEQEEDGVVAAVPTPVEEPESGGGSDGGDAGDVQPPPGGDEGDVAGPKRMLLMGWGEIIKFGVLFGIDTIQMDYEKYCLYMMLARSPAGCAFIGVYSEWLVIGSIVAYFVNVVSVYLTDAFTRRQNVVFQCCLVLQTLFLAGMYVCAIHGHLGWANAFYQLRQACIIQSLTSVWKLLKLRIDVETNRNRIKLAALRNSAADNVLKSVVAQGASLADTESTTPSDEPNGSTPKDSSAKLHKEISSDELMKMSPQDLEALVGKTTAQLLQAVESDFEEAEAYEDELFKDSENVIISTVGNSGDVLGTVVELVILAVTYYAMSGLALNLVTEVSLALILAMNVLITVLSFTILSRDLTDPLQVILGKDSAGDDKKTTASSEQPSEPEKSDGCCSCCTKKTVRSSCLWLWERIKYTFTTPSVTNVMFHSLFINLLYYVMSYPVTIFVNTETTADSSASFSFSMSDSFSSSCSGTDKSTTLAQACSGSVDNLVQQSVSLNIFSLVGSVLYTLVLVRCPPRIYYPFVQPVMSIISAAALLCVMFVRHRMSRLLLTSLVSVATLLPYFMNMYSDFVFNTAIRSQYYGFVSGIYAFGVQTVSLATSSMLYNKVELSYLVWVCCAFYVVAFIHGVIMRAIFANPNWDGSLQSSDDKSKDPQVLECDDTDLTIVTVEPVE